MKTDRFLLFNAIIAIFFGLWYLCFPVHGLGVFNLSTDVTGQYMTRFFGSALTGIGFICLNERHREPAALKGIMRGLLVGNGFGLVVSISAQLTGMPNMLCWSIVLIYLLLVAGYIYFLFFAKDNADSTSES
jgi:hypothetical protein